MSTVEAVTQPVLLRFARPKRLLWLVAAVALVDLAWSGGQTALSLRAARSELLQASDLARTADVGSAAEHLRAALAAASRAEDALGHPSTWVLGHVGLGRDLDALHALADVAQTASRTGLDLVGTLTAGGERGELLRAGRIGQAPLERITLSLEQARQAAAQSITVLDELAPARLPAVRHSVSETLDRLQGVERLGGRVLALSRAMPALVGHEGSRRYLLVFQSPSEARGGGGLPGLYGVLSAEKGRLNLGAVAPVGELTSKLHHDVSAPRWFRHLYGSLGATEDFRLSNLSVNFPATAQIWLRMYSVATGRHLDGVMAMDPIALGKLTKATGPLTARGWDARIDHASARRLLLRQIYLRFGMSHSNAQDRYLRALVMTFWKKLLGEDVGTADLVAAWADAARTQHFKIYSTHPLERSALADLGIAGDLRSYGNNVQAVFHNNWSGSKIDALFRRRIETEIALQEDGSAEFATTAVMKNRAGNISSLLSRGGIENGLAAGTNQMTLSFLLPTGAEVRDVTVEGSLVPYESGMDSGFPVVWTPLQLSRGAISKVTVHYVVEAFMRDGRDARLTLYPQTTVRPDLLFLSIKPPASLQLSGLEGRPRAEDGTVIVQGIFKAPKTLEWELTPRR